MAKAARDDIDQGQIPIRKLALCDQQCCWL